ncbi:MAG: DUF3881 family protein [Lachnospiraceae bacterium]
MHDYLAAIGFAGKEQYREIISETIENPDEEARTTNEDGTSLIQYNKKYGEHFGISVVGEINQRGYIDVEYCYPYVIGENPIYQEIQVEKHSDKNAYAGVFESIHIGIPVIFYAQNFIHYLNMRKYRELFPSINNVILSGLSVDGMIILSVKKDPRQAAKELKINDKYDKLVQEARKGDMDAIENLTLEDMDLYSQISKRTKKEDVLTIVDSYWMPYGIETDKYSILGTIVQVREEINRKTFERIYYLSIICNSISIEVCINKMYLFGEPKVGRRFKGVIWLQGNLDYI